MFPLFISATIALLAPASLCAAINDSPCWSELPPLPDKLGFAGPFLGTHNGALLVAGGAYFPDGPPRGMVVRGRGLTGFSWLSSRLDRGGLRDDFQTCQESGGCKPLLTRLHKFK